MKPNNHQPPVCPPGHRPDNSIESMIADARHDRDERLERVHEVEEREAHKKDVSIRRLYVLGPILLILILINVFLARRGPGLFDEDEQITAARMQIYMTVTSIEAFQDTAGCPPASLRQIDMEFPGICYELVGSSYKVSARVGSKNIMYMRGEAIAPFSMVEDELALEVSPW